MSDARNLTSEWASLLLSALAAAGVREVLCSPGSRSTPLVLAAAELASRGALHLHDVIDERAAAFHALGVAKTTGRPAVLLCTSGTAAAHYLPAVIEAAHAYAPMVILTADRPFELQGNGAPQTIDQVKLFGGHARAFFDLGLPDASDGAMRALRRVAAQAVAASLAPVPGAVQVNVRARKPLEPPPRASWTSAERVLHERAAALGAEPLLRVLPGRGAPDERAVDELAEACLRARRAVIVAGPAPMTQSAACADLFALSRATGFPLFPEAASQLRFAPAGERGGAVHCDGFDGFLRSRAFREAAAPDLVIQIGAAPTSSAIDGWLEAHPRAPRWVVAAHGIPDPWNRAAAVVQADPGLTARLLVARIAAHGAPAPEVREWAGRFEQAQAVAWAEVDAAVDDQAGAAAAMTEAAAVRATLARAPRGSVLALGNSLPIREVDALCRGEAADVLVWSQRGVNGIDGLLAGAAGAARAGHATTLLLGDVSALHDAGGLGAARGLEAPFVAVVLHNGGGRIFDQLAIGARPDLEEHLHHFTTPHDLSLEPVARLHGHRFVAAPDVPSLAAALDQAHRQPGVTLIEARVAAGSAAELSLRIARRVDAAFTRRPQLLQPVTR